MPCRFPGPPLRGKLRGLARLGLHTHTRGGLPALGGMPAQEGGVETPPVKATAAGGTHPTGMYSCSMIFLR